MKQAEAGKPTQAENEIRRSTFITVVCDVVLIMALVVCLLIYISSNNATTYSQNINSITNIATAKSELLLAALDNTSHDVTIAYRYCSGRSATDILDYLSIIGDEANEYQLLKLDTDDSTNLYHVYTGYSTFKTNGAYTPLEYADTDLATSLYLHSDSAAGELCYSQSFTNKTDALRYFAIFCGIDAEENGVMQRYYLVKPQKESRVLDQLQTFSQYSALTTAVCYADGKYLARDNSFRADNFYDYLYGYNDLSMDERNAIRTSVQSSSDGAGHLEYQDLKRRDCIFAYAACGGERNFNVIVSVPVSEFVSGQLLSFFPLTIIVFLAVLLFFNVWRLLIIVRQLRQSVERERIANASKSSFLSRISHEIRTPLNAVIGYNTIAKDELRLANDEASHRQAGTRVMDCLTKSDIASKHLLTIINDVLDMSAIESGKIKVAHDKFDFKGLITSLTTVFYPQARTKGVDFEVLFDTFTEEWFIGDQTRTNQIITNLLSNAIKFTPDGGKVTLRITQPEASSNASHIHFEVSDTGIGMSEEYIERIWAPFEQADSSISRRFGGTGLGLSITKNLVDLMGGTISVESELGKGTTFIVDLTFERVEPHLDKDVYDFSTVNALIVDDDASTRDYIRLLFNDCGAKCASVASGADAVEAVKIALQHGEPYSFCLVDWRMPGMDGIETIKQIKKIAGNELPMIVLTAYDYSELADKAQEVGVSKFISKPLFQSSLFDMLANIGVPNALTAYEKEARPDFSGSRILLAEDNVMNMEIASRILASVGFIVDRAWNGMECVELFSSSADGGYSAILMDVHMPEMDGHEAARAIRAGTHPQAASIPIIAMTADAFAENVAESLASGMNDHIAKPIDVAILYQALAKYIK